MKTIVAIFFALGAFLASLLINGQSKSDKVYRTFDNVKKVTYTSFSKNTTDAITIRFVDEVNEYKKS